MITRIIRWSLMLMLVIGVYTETGIWTASAIALISVFVEITGYTIARLLWVIDGIASQPTKEDKE